MPSLTIAECVWQILGRSDLFAPPSPTSVSSPKNTILNKIKTTNLRFPYNMVAKSNYIFALLLSFKIIFSRFWQSINNFRPVYFTSIFRMKFYFNIVTRLYIFIFVEQLPIKLKFLSEKKRKIYRLTVNINI